MRPRGFEYRYSQVLDEANDHCEKIGRQPASSWACDPTQLHGDVVGSPTDNDRISSFELATFFWFLLTSFGDYFSSLRHGAASPAMVATFFYASDTQLHSTVSSV